jgi:hypothetical protein
MEPRIFEQRRLLAYAAAVDMSEPVWPPSYYDFDVFSGKKANEKLEYMRNNPVKKGLVTVPRTGWFGKMVLTETAGWSRNC